MLDREDVEQDSGGVKGNGSLFPEEMRSFSEYVYFIHGQTK